MKNLETNQGENNKKFSEQSVKYKIFYFVRFIILLSILMFASMTFLAPLTRLTSISVTLVMSFLMFSLFYFNETTKNERIILLNMWKIYFSILSLMMIFLYNTEDNLRQYQLELQKTKLTYELSIKSNDVNKTFAVYENIIKSYLANNKQEKIKDLSKMQNEDIKIKKYYTIWYGNFAINIINIITLFMFLWSIIEFKIFKDKEEVKL